MMKTNRSPKRRKLKKFVKKQLQKRPLKFKFKKQGSAGKRPSDIDNVVVNVEMFLESGDKIKEAKRMEIDLADAPDLPEGLLLGIQKMHVGEIANLTMRPKYSCL